MKNISITFFFFFIPLWIFAHKNDSIINIKGYYFTRYLKSELIDSYNQEVRKLKGKNYKILIDFTQISFFIPIKINEKMIDSERNILELMISENNLNKDSIFYFPIHNNLNIEKYLKYMNIDLSREKCIFLESEILSPFYKIQSDNNFLYKCIFIDGNFYNKKIVNNEKNRFKAALDIYATNRNSPFLNLFFLTEINTYKTIVEIPKVDFWYPYLNMAKLNNF